MSLPSLSESIRRWLDCDEPTEASVRELLDAGEMTKTDRALVAARWLIDGPDGERTKRNKACATYIAQCGEITMRRAINVVRSRDRDLLDALFAKEISMEKALLQIGSPNLSRRSKSAANKLLQVKPIRRNYQVSQEARKATLAALKSLTNALKSAGLAERCEGFLRDISNELDAASYFYQPEKKDA
jgi:hypothetical protein